MPSQYVQNAEALLKDLGVKVTVKFTGHRPYFTDDDDARDVFRVRLSRGRKSYSFDFGQSLTYSTGDGRNPPTVYSIVTCLERNDPGSFEQFCSEFGYDTDSRRAERAWKQVAAQYKRLTDLFTPEELDRLREIQ